MSKKLAIIGHSTRGKEVIELLEMLGGNVDKKILSAANIGDILNPHVYFFDPDSSDNRIVWYYLLGLEADGRASEMKIFTLEEFLEKYPFKVGDKVIDEADGCPGVVCEMKWDEGVSDMKYCVAFGNGIDFGWFANDSINYFKIKKDENLEENKFPSFEPMFKINDELEYKIPDGYEITEVSKGKVFIKPIKSKYPTTYEECYDEGNTELHFIYVDKDERDLYELFIQLIRCRTAYWKIAGEEMGLDKPWEPDYLKDANTIRYAIYNTGDEIVKLDGKLYRNYILCFPTEEMRDAFYENFKKEIEQCKELL